MLNGEKIDFESTEVDADSPLARAILVKAKLQVYGFPPDTRLTRAGDFLIVRGYGGIFIYSGRDVEIRFLGTLKPIPFEGLPAEPDPAVLDSVTQPPVLPRPEDDLCPDCVFPVVSS